MLNLALALLADPQLGQPVSELPPLDAKNAVASADHERLAFETRTEGVWILDLATGQVGLRVPGTSDGVARLAWNADGSSLAVRHEDGRVTIHDSSSGRVTATLATPVGTFVSFGAGGSRIIVAVNHAGAEVWPSTGGDRISHLVTASEAEMCTIRVSPDGEYLALGDADGRVAVWSVRDCALPAHELSLPGDARPRIQSLAFDSADKLLAITADDCRIRLWKLGSAELPFEFSHCDLDIFGDLSVGCVRFSADGTMLLSTSHTFWEVRVWSVQSRELVAHFDYAGGNDCPMPAWFSTDGRFVTTALGLRTMCVAEPSKAPVSEGSVLDGLWWESDGDVAWAIGGGHLLVRKIPDEEPVLRIPVRER